MEKNEIRVPLWLDIKTEYIDENFDRVLDYLKVGNRNESFYQTTIELLGKRVEEYQKSQKNRPLNFSELIEQDTGKLRFESRLIAAYLLAKKDMDTIAKKRLFTSLIYSLSLSVNSDLCVDLLGLVMDNIIYENEPALLYGWDDLISFEPQIMVYKMINGAIFTTPREAQILFESKGAIFVHEEAIGLANMNKDDIKKRKYFGSSIGILDGKLRLLTSKGERLKPNEEGKIENIEKFTRKFTEAQTKMEPSKSNAPKQVYAEGDSLLVAVTAFSFGKIKVKSIDPNFEQVAGMLDFSVPVYPFYYPEDFYKYLKEGQIIDVTLVDCEKKLFSIRDGFVAYVIENVVKDGGQFGKSALAMVTRIFQDKRGKTQMDWWSCNGYPVHTQYDEKYVKGDFGYVKVTGLGDNDYYGYIYASIINRSSLRFDLQATKKSLIEGFNFDAYEKEEAETESMLNAAVIRDVLNMMIRYQKSIVQPMERFKALSISMVLATLIGSSEHQAYVGFIMSYLKQLIHFARGTYAEIEELAPDNSIADLDLVKHRCNVVKILKAYGKADGNSELETIIAESSDELLVKIAKLIQSSNIIGEVLPVSTKNIIKREITRNLSLETEDETDLDEENGIYLGIENLHQEFKTSFVYPPDNDMQPNLYIQERNIFRCLCGFLNTEGGGTLYIGVTDLGYVCGFDNDMQHLHMTEIDTYTRLIQDEASRFYPVDVLKHFIIKPMYDNRVIAIRVEPYVGGVVEFDGKAYIRINNETMEMNDKLKKMIRAKKMEK